MPNTSAVSRSEKRSCGKLPPFMTAVSRGRRTGWLAMPRAVGLCGVLITAGAIVAMPTPTVQAAGCQFIEGGGPAAFCDTFDAPSGSNTRAGDLNPIVWGVSRVGGPSNPGQGQYMSFPSTMLNKCGTSVAVAPPNDVAICDGKLVESLNDDGGLAQLAMYPRQPFDIAGRTGSVVFDVSNDSMGSHAAWPEFSYTDQPIPVPGPSQIAFNGFGESRNSVNLSFAAYNPPGHQGQVCVDNVWITSNYAMTQKAPVLDGCMLEPAQNSLVLNHVEIQLSPSGGVVFGSDAGTTTMHQLTHWAWSDLGLSGPPLTRGLVWMKDTHYNAVKPYSEGAVPFDQQVHTFAWDNFGFDGPVLTRDLGAELPDGNQPQGTAANGQPQQNLYFNLSNPVTFNLPSTLGNGSVQELSGVENAESALLEMSVYSFSPSVVISYAVNGNPAHTYTRSVSGPNFSVQPFAMPIPVSELQDGANSIVVSATANTGTFVGNVDVILVGAAAASSAPAAAPSTPTPTTVFVNSSMR